MSLSLGVEFGPICFDAHGEYSSQKKENRKFVDYTIIRNCPMYNVYLSPSELSNFAVDPMNNAINLDADESYFTKIEKKIAHYQKQNRYRRVKDVNENGLTKDQQEEIDNMYDAIPVSYDFGGIFSASFTKIYNELYNTITRRKLQNKEVDQGEVNKVFDALDNAYGPFFISGGDYGGSLSMHCLVDEDSMDGTEFYDGDLSASLAGMLDVEGEFHYTSTGVNLLRRVRPDIYIWGGNSGETVDKMISALYGEDVSEVEQWQTIIKDWIASMYSPSGDNPDQSMAAPVRYTITPVWTLFSEVDIQAACQEYFLEKYRDRGIYKYFGIMQGTEPAPTADEWLNKDSAWNNSY